jgi:ketosteroid isomerase-like protein
MSEENVEVVRRGLRATDRGLAALNAYFDEVVDPGVEFRAVGHLPDASGSVRGLDGVKKWYARLFESFDYHVEEEELIDIGDAVVLVARQTARGSGSGIEVSNRIVVLFRFTEGKIISTDAYRTKTEALEAAGLSE